MTTPMDKTASRVTDERLTQNEFRELFGDEIPIEAVQFVFHDAPANMSMSEVRAKLREIAEKHRSLSSDSVSDGSKGVTIADLQVAHVTRQEEWCPDQKPDLSFRGNEMAGEVGEACNVIKKLERERHGWRGSRDTLDHLGEELADVVHTAVLCAITAGIDLGPFVVSKFNSTSEKNGLSTFLALDSGTGEQQPVALGCDDLDEWIIGELSNAKALSPDGMSVMTTTATVLRAVREALSVYAPTEPKAGVVSDSRPRDEFTCGMAVAAGIIMQGWGSDVLAGEILNNAGLTTVAEMRKAGVENYDIRLCVPVLRHFRDQARARAHRAALNGDKP